MGKHEVHHQEPLNGRSPIAEHGSSDDILHLTAEDARQSTVAASRPISKLGYPRGEFHVPLQQQGLYFDISLAL